MNEDISRGEVLLHALDYFRVNHFPFLPPPPPKWGFPNGSLVKNLPATQETREIRIQSLGWEDPLEKEMATHFSILAWRIPWTEKPGGLLSMGVTKSRTGLKRLSMHIPLK